MSLAWYMTPDKFRRDLLLSVNLPTDLVNDEWKDLSEGEQKRINKALTGMCHNSTVPQIYQFTR